MSAERVLVWGAGAVGAAVGAALVDAGLDVTFVDRDQAHVDAMRSPAHGLTIDGPVWSRSGPVQAFTPEELTGEWDTILLSVKAHHTAGAAAELAPHLGSGGQVVTLQNGLAARIAGEVIGRERILIGFVNFGADRIGPGHITLGNRGAVAIGEWDGHSSDRLDRIWRMMSLFEPEALRTDAIWSFIWGKLAYASFLFAEALCTAGIAKTLDRSELLPLWRALAREVIDVAHAESVMPAGFNGFDPAAFESDAPLSSSAASIATIADLYRRSSKRHSGVWRDLAVHRRTTEADAQLGMVVEIAAEHGLRCPTLAALIAMIHEVEAGKRAQNDDNLTELADALFA